MTTAGCDICDRPTDGVYQYCRKHHEAIETEVAAGRAGHIYEWVAAQKEEHKIAEERKRAATEEVAGLALTERMLNYSHEADTAYALHSVTPFGPLGNAAAGRLFERVIAYSVAAFICWASGGAIKP